MHGAGMQVSRRGVLAGLLLAGPALAACSPAGSKPPAPDPLIALADAARADAALATALVAATPALADRVNPLRDARALHAKALDAEVARLDPARASATPAPAPAPSGEATLPALRAAVTDSGKKAAAIALTAPTARAGLVASVAACCTTYAGVLG
jgi:hypothetical protein